MSKQAKKFRVPDNVDTYSSLSFYDEYVALRLVGHEINTPVIQLCGWYIFETLKNIKVFGSMI